jgi:adenosylcobinamide-phosphate synthase
VSNLEILLIALILDAIFGEPDWLWRTLPHPAALMGRAVGWFERMLNKGTNRRAKGIATLICLTAIAAIVGCAFSALPDQGVFATILTAILLAQHSLATHTAAVARGLAIGLPEGRQAVALIVGRDPNTLDKNGVARSAIESAAENFSDALVAPALWALLFGLPGIMIYKMVNTADSMIGYRNDRYGEFGWAAARFDDLINWIPARISGGLICAAHGSAKAFSTMRRDAPLHRSPNAGWPEAATAAVLGVAISGPRTYGGVATQDPYVNAEGRYQLIPADIDRAVRVIWRAWGLLLVLLILVWGILG